MNPQESQQPVGQFGGPLANNPKDQQSQPVFEYKVDDNNTVRITDSFHEAFTWKQKCMIGSMFRVVMYSRLKGALHWKLYSAGKSVVSKGERGYE